MEKNDVSKELKNILEAMILNLDLEIEQETKDIIKISKDKKLNLENPEMFGLYVSYKMDRYLRAIAKELHATPEIKDKHKCDFIYVQYHFLENNIEELCIKRSGSACSADKSRYIINMFLKYSLTGKIPEFDPNIEKFYIPKFGTNEDWMNFCDGLYKLYYGKSEQYLKSLNKLLTCEMRKYEHTLHVWYVKLNTGENIKVGNNWDDNNDNPLDNIYFDKGDFYVIRDERLENLGYELYEDSEFSFSFSFSKYYKVPKSNIESIYCVSTKEMC